MYNAVWKHSEEYLVHYFNTVMYMSRGEMKSAMEYPKCIALLG